VLTQKSSTWDRNPWYSPDEPVYKGTVVRARAIKEGALPSQVVTHAYFIADETHNRYALAVVALSVQENALFDYEKGIYVAGKDFDDWRRSNPNLQVNGGRPGNYHRAGKEWEYPAHIEVFEGGKGKILSQDIGIRAHGGLSRSFPVKSIRLYARNEYGPSHFNYAFFPDQQDSTFQREHLRDFFNLGADYQLEVEVSDTEGGHVKVNSLQLLAGTEGLAENVYPWSGTYFRGVPITLEAVPAPGFFFAGWQGSSSSSSGNISLEPDSDVSLRAVFKSLTSGIEDVAQTDFEIKVYPNPFKTETELKIKLQSSKQLMISLQDLSGKIHAEIARESLMPGEYGFKIQAPQLTPGFYILNCQLDGERVYFKGLKN
jgi:hypothetical protein